MKVNIVEHSKEQNTHFLVIADLHEEKIDIPTYEIMKQYARIYGVERLIILGDFFEFEYFMEKSKSYQQWVGRKDGIEEFFLPKFEESMLWGNSILDELQLIFKEIYFVFGNHDERINIFRETECLAEYKHHFYIEEKLKLKERKISFYQYNDYLDIGSLATGHGMFHAKSHFAQHFLACEAKNFLCGHLHRDEKLCFTSRGKTKQVQTLPCMSCLNPTWLRNKDNNWTLGFGHLIVKPNDHFNYYTLNVWDNELVLPDDRVLR